MLFLCGIYGVLMSDIHLNETSSEVTFKVNDSDHTCKCSPVDALCSKIFATVTLGLLTSVCNVNETDVRLWKWDAAKLDSCSARTLLKAEVVGAKELGNQNPSQQLAKKMTLACWDELPNYQNFEKKMSPPPAKTSEAYAYMLSGLRLMKASLNPMHLLGGEEHACGMNPQALSANQKGKTPILLIHGMGAGPSAWISLAKKFQKADPDRPVFTVYLPPGGAMGSEKEYAIIKQKMDDIKKLYGADHEDTKIDIVGHSKGATLADQVASGTCLTMERDSRMGHTQGNFKFTPTKFSASAENMSSMVGKVIKLDGPTFHPEQAECMAAKGILENAHEINGTSSRVVCWDSALNGKVKESHQTTVDAGHAGILFNEEAHEKILDILKFPSSAK